MTNSDTKGHKVATAAPVELKMCARPGYLPLVRGLVRGMAQLVGLENKDDSVTLAVEEALTNVIRHSYGGPCEKPIILKLRTITFGDENRPALEIVIRDFGTQVDPQIIRGRSLDEVRPGGLGMHIIRSVMDVVEFSPADDCGMQLRLVKSIK